MEAEEGLAPLPERTCINEAALVAAGFAYRPVRKPEDMPGCFSRPICQLAMRLNDMAKTSERQRLLAFVGRLACADTPETEQERADYIAFHAEHGLSVQKGLEILEGALSIGRRADPLLPNDVRSRMGAVQQDAARQVWAMEIHLLSTLRNWVVAATQPEPVR